MTHRSNREFEHSNERKHSNGKRCMTCGKKLNQSMRIVGLCRCGNVYCSAHRSHDCNFDYTELRKPLRGSLKSQVDAI